MYRIITAAANKERERFEFKPECAPCAGGKMLPGSFKSTVKG